VTRSEFDVWIEQHYGELLAVAKKKGDGEDAVQAAVLSALETRNYERCHPGAAWTWFSNAVRGKAKDQRVSETRTRRAKQELKKITGAALYQGGRTKPAPGSDNPVGGDQ
jgi:DNA-directed RNA polymerase specialized sigma24 family protein